MKDVAADKRAYRPDLDGIRALAILGVVLYHAGMPGLTGGFTGVDIFFVLSGYLIGGHIYAELRGGTFSYARFYQRRARRILPAFFAVLAFTLAVALILLSPAEAADLGRSALAATLSASNILFWGTTNYFAGKSSMDPMLMTWSLGVEEQFYAVVPVTMICLKRMRRSLMLPAAIAVCVLSFGFSWMALGSHPMAAFYLLPARAWELGAGVALAMVEAGKKCGILPARWIGAASAAGTALMIGPMFLLNAETAFPGPAALPSVLGTALAIATPAGWISRRVLSFNPLVFIGKVSYSFYLWHWPLLAFLRIVYGGSEPAAMRVAALTIAFAAAVISYFLIEQPFRRSRNLPAPMLARYALAIGVGAILSAAVWLSGGVPQRFPSLERMEEAQQALRSDPCLAGYGKDRPDLSRGCEEVAASGPAVALWGDSHSAALAPGLRRAAQTQRYGFVQLGKASCPPLVGATHFVPRIPLLAGECSRFNRHVLGALQSDARIGIVILNADWAGYLYRDWQDGWLASGSAPVRDVPTEDASIRLFQTSLAATIETLRASGKQVVVMKDVPGFEFNPVWRVRTRSIPARTLLAGWLGVKNAGDPGFADAAADAHIALADSLLAETVANFRDVTLADLKPALCNSSSQCAYRNGETMLYDDSNHLSADGAIYAVRDLRLPAMARGANPQIGSFRDSGEGRIPHRRQAAGHLLSYARLEIKRERICPFPARSQHTVPRF